MNDHPFTPEERRRSFITCLIVSGTLFVILMSVPVYILVTFRRDYGPAEELVSTLRGLYVEIEPPVDQEKFEQSLSLPQYAGLRKMQVFDDVRPGEIAWFRPNQKYTIGICDDGAILWKVDGARVSKTADSQ